MKKLLVLFIFVLTTSTSLFAKDFYSPTVRDVQSIESVAYSMRDLVSASEYADVWLPIRNQASDIIILLSSGKPIVNNEVIRRFYELVDELSRHEECIQDLRDVEYLRPTANRLLVLIKSIQNDLD